MKTRRKAALLAVMAVATSAILQVGPVASAGAAAPDFLLQMPATDTTPGDGAGELSSPGAVAGDPQTGHVFVADGENNRISEYTAWGLFVKAWGWGVADGAPELQTCGPPEPQEDPDPTLCQSGSAGDAAGQVWFPLGLAVDPDGNVYVHEWFNHRVQKFSSDGEFLLMFGGGVNQGPLHPGDVCTATHIEEGDVCGAGTVGEGPAQLDELGGDHLAYSPAGGGTILVGDKGGIEVFDLDGNHVKRIGFEGPLSSFAGESVWGLDVDKDGNVYFTLDGVPDIYKLSPAGAPLAPGMPGGSGFKVADSLAVAVDAQGNVYAIEFKGGYLLGYEADGTPIAGMTAAAKFAGGNDLRRLAVNECDGSEGPNLYLSRNRTGLNAHSLVEAYGPGPIGCEPPPIRPPEVVEQFSSSVGREEATVKARVNPLFWPDTTYYVEYGTSPCSEGSCPLRSPLAPATLTNKSINRALTTSGVVLEGLQPQTTYHFRFVAQSSGGGPVFGIDPDGREGPALAREGEGLEATFRTSRPAGKAAGCVNDAVRTGPSAQLPDCRAYELVSPLDKGGGDVALWEVRNDVPPASFETNKSAPGGERFTYTSFLAFGDAESAPFGSQHLAERGANGWSSEPISPPRSESPVLVINSLDDEFQGFTEDLCGSWLRLYSVAPLAVGAIAGNPNIYRRGNCLEPPAYEAITVKPPSASLSPSGYTDLRTKGFSRDGSHVIFATKARLEGTGAPKVEAGGDLLYEHTDGGLRFVCYLPNGKASTEPCSAGTLVNAGFDHASLHNAISEDGSRIFWTAYTVTPSVDPRQPGRIFVRIDGKDTRRVSTAKANDPAFFWTASSDGSKAIFSFTSGPLDDQIYEVDVDTETPTLIAKGVEGPMGASEDASRIYFASSEDLDAGGPAASGEHNLYLYEAGPGGGSGEITFIMELGDGDVRPPIVGGPATRPVDFLPSMRAARVSPDGLHATFMSTASPTPTGYDNRDGESNETLAEVYLYDAVSKDLRCVSCNPGGARPSGQILFPGVAAAARIQGWEQRNHAPRVLSDDGKRVFFESFEALTPRDTNGTWDVYQWEEAGKGTCTSASETFSDDSGGCVDLISAGTSPAKSTFLDADPSGDNVFFSTQSSLVGQDYGLNDVYLARVGGGFPEPVVRAPCAGEACQSPPPPPSDVTPATRTAAGPGNVRKRCPKGKRRVKRAGKVRCVKRKGAKAKRKAKARKNRRAGR